MDTQRLRDELATLKAANGAIQPRDLWRRAKSRDHWLHDHFEWNDSIAADRYRDAQAAALIRAVKLVDEPVAVRELHPVRLENGPRSYEPLGDVATRETWACQLRTRIQSEIVSQVGRWLTIGQRVGLDVDRLVTDALRQADKGAA